MTTWKDRLWQLFLVITFGIVLSVCTNNSSTSKKSGLAYADYKPSDVTAVMYCNSQGIQSNGERYMTSCDASDSTTFTTISSYSNSMSLVNLVSAGWRPCSSAGYFCK
jgi:hypothetical protein